jgi:hypothetical protein
MEFFLAIARIALTLTFGGIAIILFTTGIKIIFADKTVYQANQRATGSVLNAIRGTVRSFIDGGRDHRVHAGLGFDLKNQRFVSQGMLSDESIEQILR